MMLVLFLTLSRGGIAAAAIATLVFLAFAADRLPKLVPLAIAAVAGGLPRSPSPTTATALHEGLANATAREQGDELLPIVIVVCAAVGLLQAGISALGRRWQRPDWTRPSKQGTWAGVAIGAVVVLVVALARRRAGPRSPTPGANSRRAAGRARARERLSSAAGESRYQFWSAAVDENATAPLIGTGSGTFEFWWAREGDADETVRDAHSLYLQTLGELGIVGLLILLAFLAWVFVSGLRAALLSDAAERSRLAAALAGFTVFLLTAAVDWMWQVPVVPVAVLLLACGLLVARGGSDKPRLLGSLAGRRRRRRPCWRSSRSRSRSPRSSLVRQSEAEARAGDYPAALDDAKSAQNVEPGAATPRLQEALVLELMRRLPRRRSGGPRGGRPRVDQLAAPGWSSRGSPPRTATPTPRSPLTKKRAASIRAGRSSTARQMVGGRRAGWDTALRAFPPEAGR